MSKRETIEQKAESLLLPILDEFGFELVDVEFVKESGEYYLRAYIDKEGGITIDDCESVSRAFNPLLDEEDFIEEAYIMEISSPGLGRHLKKEKDFARNLGKELEVHTYRVMEGNKEFFGVLVSYDENQIVIRTEDGTELTFLRKDLSVIRQAVYF